MGFVGTLLLDVLLVTSHIHLIQLFILIVDLASGGGSRLMIVWQERE